MVKQVTTDLARTVLAAALLLGLLGLGQAVLAGDIDLSERFAWGANAGWINFAPSPASGSVAPVTVYPDHLEGYAYGENIGWIRLGTHTSGGDHTYANDAAGSYGVNNDGCGNLSGYAWGTNVGWINFDPSNDEQVTVDPVNGEFDGYAYGENIGFFRFQGTSPDYKVQAGPAADPMGSLAAGYANDIAAIVTGRLPDPATSSGLSIANNDFLNDTGDCIIFGHNNVVDTTAVDVPTDGDWAAALAPARWTRAWDFDVHDGGGAGGTVDLTFDFGDAGYAGVTPAGDAGNYRLLKRVGESGQFTDIGAASGYADDTVTFSGVDVTQLGSNFALGTLNDHASPVGANIAPSCWVERTGDETPDHASMDAGALRDAVNAALAGSTLKVAGTCAGTAGNRVVYIDKELTIVGGYDSSDWSAPPDSVANPTVLDAQQGGRVAVIAGNATVTLRHLTLRNGLASGQQPWGGAIRVNTGGALSLAESRIENSQAQRGGAIFNKGVTEIDRSTLSNNQAEIAGAVYSRESLTTITASTFVNNNATNGNGGAIYEQGGTIDVLNSTFSGNNATSGGAIYITSLASGTVRYSTFSGNGASQVGSGTVAGGDGITLIGTIVADSTSGGDCAGAVVNGGYNLIEDGSCITEASSSSGDPALLPLADNGGPTQTFLPSDTSPAIDRITAGFLDCGAVVSADQRGVERPAASFCDGGAVEVFPSPECSLLCGEHRRWRHRLRRHGCRRAAGRRQCGPCR